MNKSLPLLLGAGLLAAALAASAQAPAPAPAPAAAASAPLADSPEAQGRRIAAEAGCVNCHGSVPRGDSPTLKHMSEGLVANRVTAQHLLEEMGDSDGGIVAHHQLSRENAELIVRWLAAGMK